MRLASIAAGLAAALLLAACGSGDDTPAPAGLDVDIHDGDFARIQQFTTPGGVSVWLVEEPSIPILALQMDWKGGVAADPEDLEGLGEAVVYQMNEGAGDLDSLAFQTRMEELNMSFGCGIAMDWTNCSARMLTGKLEDSLDLVALAFAAPRFDEGPFERHRREDLVGIKQRETNPRYLAAEAQEDALYPDHPYARDISVDSVNARTPEAALAHKDALMTKDRLLVTAVGAVSPETLAPLLDAVFASLPETSDLPDIPPIDPGRSRGTAPITDRPCLSRKASSASLAPGLAAQTIPDFFRRLCAELHLWRRRV